MNLTRETSFLSRLFPRQADNRFAGNRAALWLLALFIALKLMMSLNSILSTATIARGADGFPLDRYGPEAARAVLMLFSLVGLGQLALAGIALTVLIRYRTLVPLIYLTLLVEQLARRWIIQAYAVERTMATPAASYVGWGLLALLTLGLGLSLFSTRADKQALL